MIFSNELFIMAISMFKATITVQITYAIKNRRPKADVRRKLGSLTAISPSSTRPSNNQNMANRELGWLGMKRKMETSNPVDTGMHLWEGIRINERCPYQTGPGLLFIIIKHTRMLKQNTVKPLLSGPLRDLPKCPLNSGCPFNRGLQKLRNVC